MDKNVLLQFSSEEENRDAGQKITKHPLVMVVENDPNASLLISMLLRNAGYTVIEATNGENALAMLRENKPEIILMDVNMPVMDGYTATKRIREMVEPYCSAVILGLVADALPDDRERCRTAGMDDCISKPFRLEEVLGKIKFPPAA